MKYLQLLAAQLKGVKGNVGINNVHPLPATQIVQNVLNAAYFIAGIVAVGMIIFAGIQYLTANGEPAKAKKAMNTIIFAIVGLVIIIAAFAITSFVISQVGGK